MIARNTGAQSNNLNTCCHVETILLPDKRDKVIPLQTWTGPEGYRRVRLPDFKTVGT